MDESGNGSRTGREYLRVSLDRSGRARSVDEQHDDNARAATGRGVTLARPYVDNSVSASRYSSKARDDFAKLMDDLGRGRFGADELWLWESSRGSRKVGEWVQLIEACEKASVHIFVTTHARAYDPANGRDRRSLLEDAVDSEYESSKVSARSRRAAAAGAAAGKPHGQAPFGYVRRYDEHTRRMVAQEPDPIEAPIVRELFDRLASGQSLREIESDFGARGVRTRTGRVFSAQHLRTLALNASYAGLRVHDPDGRRAGRRNPRPGPGVLMVDGTWPALVPKAMYFKVSKRLTDPSRVTTRPGRAKHLLSMIARCAECGGPLSVTTRRERPEYSCRDRGCVRIRQDELDDYAEKMMFAYLARPDVTSDLASADTDSAEIQNVRDELAATRARLDELTDAVVSGAVSVGALARAEPALLAQITNLEAQEQELSAPALHGLIRPGPNAGRHWQELPVSTRREVARILLEPAVLGTLCVQRRPEGRRNVYVPAEDRIEWRTS